MAIRETHFNFHPEQSYYKGKVRDVYQVGERFVAIASDRISAFDHILPKAIPYKGQVLNQLAVYFLEATRDIVPNWLQASPDPNVSIGLVCEPIKIEMVIRGYLAGHAWREYKLGKRMLCGAVMPDGMKENDPFPVPIITPATKAESGHDEDISPDDILNKRIVTKPVWDQLEQYTRALYQKGQEMANARGLILVDTKYEFGMYQGIVTLIDEIHTPDSSRYFYMDGYHDRQESGSPQEQLSKEFVREWLMDHGFQGLDGQKMPEMPEAFVKTVSERYIKLFEILTGNRFIRRTYQDIDKTIYNRVMAFITA